MKYAHTKYPTGEDRIRAAQLGCTIEMVRPSSLPCGSDDIRFADLLAKACKDDRDKF